NNSLEDLRQAQQDHQPDENILEDEIIPTHFKVNQFTKPFQNMNDVYGVPSYNEINPALFTCITFPFLFGSMFGDVGHGLILFFISIFLIKFDKIKKYHEMIKLMVDSKYMLMVCSLYAIFFGFIYSDFLGLPIKLFKFKNITFFGIDPDIHKAKDHLNIMNGIKMKLSVIIGTIHMFLGLIINCLNTFYKKEKLIFFCQTLPKIISFGCFTGHLFILIIIKYIFPFKPSIINTIVGMFTDPFNDEDFFYKYQLYVQILLLALYIICLPWMLISYPIICFIRQRKSKLESIKG
ncbi:H+- or Na+-translocating F-type, V-type and A-type ATPase (F-ATPase) Superfamily protein, partial [Pseudoloma neurophilia]